MEAARIVPEALQLWVLLSHDRHVMVLVIFSEERGWRVAGGCVVAQLGGRKDA